MAQWHRYGWYTVCHSYHQSHNLSITYISTFLLFFKNLVMFLSLVVAWVIPDVPKTIVEQLKREKKLLVDVFLQEEKEKLQLIQSLFAKDATLQPSGNTLPPGQDLPIPGRYSTLPSGPTAGEDRGGPRARCRAASFSQFNRNIASSPMKENENSKHTAVWDETHVTGVLQLVLWIVTWVTRSMYVFSVSFVSRYVWFTFWTSLNSLICEWLTLQCSHWWTKWVWTCVCMYVLFLLSLTVYLKELSFLLFGQNSEAY